MPKGNVLQCIRETIEAELRPRNKNVRDRVQGSDRKIASTQGALSGAAIAARAQIACDELTVRAEIIWSIIQRCHKSFGSERGDSLLADLQHQINELVSAEAVTVFNHVDGGASVLHYPTPVRNHIDDALTVRRYELTLDSRTRRDSTCKTSSNPQKPSPAVLPSLAMSARLPLRYVRWRAYALLGRLFETMLE